MTQPIDPMTAMQAQIAAIHEAILGDMSDTARPGILRRQDDHSRRLEALEANEKGRIDKRWAAVLMIAGWFGPKAIDWAQQHLK